MTSASRLCLLHAGGAARSAAGRSGETRAGAHGRLALLGAGALPELLADTSALLDTSFSLGSLTPRDEALPLDRQMLSDEAFVSLVRAFGAERILFGSDCP